MKSEADRREEEIFLEMSAPEQTAYIRKMFPVDQPRAMRLLKLRTQQQETKRHEEIRDKAARHRDADVKSRAAGDLD